MKQLFAGIMTKFSTGAPAIYTNLAGRLRLHEAEQDEALPYAVYYMIGDAPDYYFGEQLLHSTTLQFTIFADDASSENICTYFDNLTALYDECTLTVATYGFLRMERTWAYLLRDAEEAIWQYVIQYRVTMEKTT